MAYVSFGDGDAALVVNLTVNRCPVRMTRRLVGTS